MALIVLPNVFSAGNTIIASQHNANFQTIYNDYNGNINTQNIASNAAITYSQLSIGNSVKQSDIISTFNTSSGFGLVPSGGIIMWVGSIATIPSGWYLCNGSNGTPDLRNQFVVCANADASGVAKSTISGSASQSGGSVTISVGNLPAHAHDKGGTISYQGGGSTDGVATGGSGQLTATTGSGAAYTQPYFALAYIMKS